MFFRREKKTDEALFIVVRAQAGVFTLAMGDGRRTYRSLRRALAEAQRLASKLNDGKYYVMQAVAVSQVEAPQAVTRSLINNADGKLSLSTSAVIEPEHATLEMAGPGD